MSEVKYVKNPSMFRNNPIYFVICLALCFAGVGFILLLFWFIQAKMTKFTITEDRVEVERGILSKDRTELSISNIKSVNVKQTLFQRMFGVGDIQIFTAGDKPEMVLFGLPEPLEVKKLLQ